MLHAARVARDILDLLLVLTVEHLNHERIVGQQGSRRVVCAEDASLRVALGRDAPTHVRWDRRLASSTCVRRGEARREARAIVKVPEGRALGREVTRFLATSVPHLACDLRSTCVAIRYSDAFGGAAGCGRGTSVITNKFYNTPVYYIVTESFRVIV